MEVFKCSPHRAGDLMTNGRGKDTIGKNCLSMLQDWLITAVTGKRKEIESKYFSHGHFGEPSALARAGKHFNKKFEKNDLYLENDFFGGTFDARSGDLVIDVKCPWEAHNMPYFDDEPPKGYYNQLQAYMDLTGLKKAALVYCLEDHSENEIDKLAARLAYQQALKLGLDPSEHEPTMEHWNEAKERLTYVKLPDNLRIKVYEFERNDELIERMHNRVIECREIINNDLITKIKKK